MEGVPGGCVFLGQHFSVGAYSGHRGLPGKEEEAGGSVLETGRLILFSRGAVCVWPCHASGDIGPGALPFLWMRPTQHRDDVALH